MDQSKVKSYTDIVGTEKHKTAQLLKRYENLGKTTGDVATFDSMLAQHPQGREAAMGDMPKALTNLLESKYFPEDEQKQKVFDGLNIGIAEYQRRNGGEMPSAEVVLGAIQQAVVFTENRPDDATVDGQTFDSLSFSHHEALSVVPAATQVVISYGIANSLPLVAMLPNPTGSNEVPLVSGEVNASMQMGVFSRGEAIDGAQAGMPYLENRHLLTMTKGDDGEFTLDSRVGYTAAVRANKTTKFVVDEESKAAPFLGGRVAVFVKGVEVANDKHRNHPTTTGISTLQPTQKEVTIGANKYIVTSAQADLDDHTVTVQFDITDGVEPGADDVEVDLIFDYERKDDDGNYLLKAPGVDMGFAHHGVYAHPHRSRSAATIDAITQMANELNLNWYGVVQMITMQKYYYEQNGRLLRWAVNRCLADSDNRVVTFDPIKAGITYNTVQDMFGGIRMTLGKARTALSNAIKLGIGAYDLYVSDNGAGFFEGLTGNAYTPTGEAYGDPYSIYRIGRLNTGANVYYVPKAMGVFNEDSLTNGAYALMVPRPTSPAHAPFVGHVAVPPMVLASNINAFEKDVAVYSRQAAEPNPIPRFANQCMLIEMINLPTM